MFLQWSLFTLNAFFLLLELLVAVSLEVTLTHIARKEGYAHSIRWIQQAGKWEMITALRLSRGIKAKFPLFALFTTLIVSTVLLAILTGAKSFAELAVAEGNPSQELVPSKQVVVGDIMSTFSGWSFHVPYDADMKDALTMAVNSTRSIPRAVSTKRYRPRFSKYELACDRFDFRAPNRTFLVLPNDGCAFMTLSVSSIFLESDISRMYIVRESKGRVKIVIPALTFPEYHRLLPNMVADLGVISRVDYLDEKCLTPNTNIAMLDANHAGMTSTPKTVLTKCLLTSGESVILSTSAIRFTVPSSEMFHSVATSIFGTQDELVLGMEDSVNNSTLTTLPANELEELTVMEVKVIGTEVAALVCVWARQTLAEVPHIACAYTITNALIIKSQPMNPDVGQHLVNKGLNPTWTNVTITMVLHHLPRASNNTLSFAIPNILNASAAAADYFASLGNNFVLDWEASMLYIVFDTVEILKGYEIPRWLFFSMIGVMVACLFFWIATEFLVDARHRYSLYMMVSKELTASKDGAKPRLHRFDPKTLKFEDRHRLIVSTTLPQASRDAMVYQDQTPSGSQDPLRAVAV
ncbi:hypothetical protein BGZ59_003448 [Podila verticillata]|nr:hypothetical protein BGZ59_003448 [Podila verticillata]